MKENDTNIEIFPSQADIDAEKIATWEATQGKWKAFMDGTDHADPAGLEQIEEDASNEVFFNMGNYPGNRNIRY